MNSVLTTIVEHKKNYVEFCKKRWSLADVRSRAASAAKASDFVGALQVEGRRIIAEVKRASPSEGVLGNAEGTLGWDPVGIATAYQNAGAAAISVLTDAHYFWGSEFTLSQVKEAVNVPVLRKDFIVEAYQVYESKCLGADAVLLMASVLNRFDMQRCLDVAAECEIACLVEVHSDEEAEDVLPLLEGRTNVVLGVNHRDLHTLQIDLSLSMRLADNLADDLIVVAESGLRTAEDLQALEAQGIRRFLIGSQLIRSGSPGAELAKLMEHGA